MQIPDIYSSNQRFPAVLGQIKARNPQHRTEGPGGFASPRPRRTPCCVTVAASGVFWRFRAYYALRQGDNMPNKLWVRFHPEKGKWCSAANIYRSALGNRTALPRERRRAAMVAQKFCSL